MGLYLYQDIYNESPSARAPLTWFTLAGPWGPWMISAGRAPAGTTKYLFHKLKIFFISHKLFREALSKLKRFFRTVKLSRYNAKLSTYLHKTCFSPLCRKLSGSDR